MAIPTAGKVGYSLSYHFLPEKICYILSRRSELAKRVIPSAAISRLAKVAVSPAAVFLPGKGRYSGSCCVLSGRLEGRPSLSAQLFTEAHNLPRGQFSCIKKVFQL
jgi:hypothetical protein